MQSAKLLFLTLSAAFIWSQPLVQAETASQASTATAYEKIDAVDIQFRQIYAATRADLLRSGGPIVLWRNAALTLINGDQTKQFNYLPANFDTLKTVDHIALAIFVGLSQDSEHPSAERLTQFVKLRQMVLQAKPQIENAGFTSKVLQRQQRIIERSLAFIDKVEASKGCSRSDLHDFIHEVLPAVIDNIKDAVALDLGALDAVMTQIKSQLTSDQWTKLHVIVCGAHMARTEESHMQYFLKLLEEQGEGRKLVYFEGNAEQQDAPLNSLGTHELDSQIGVAFFGDPERMHRDLLGPAASEYLDEHPVR